MYELVGRAACGGAAWLQGSVWGAAWRQGSVWGEQRGGRAACGGAACGGAPLPLWSGAGCNLRVELSQRNARALGLGLGCAPGLFRALPPSSWKQLNYSCCRSPARGAAARRAPAVSRAGASPAPAPRPTRSGPYLRIPAAPPPRRCRYTFGRHFDEAPSRPGAAARPGSGRRGGGRSRLLCCECRSATRSLDWSRRI